MGAASASPHSRLTGRVRRLFASEGRELADPFSVYRTLREEAPILEIDSRIVLSRYADIAAVLRDTAGTYSSDARTQGRRAESERASLPSGRHREAFDAMTEFDANFMFRKDGVEHVRLRRVAHRAFTPRRIRELAGATERYAREQLDLCTGETVIDLAQFAYRVPLLVILDLLAVPHEDLPRIRSWASRVIRVAGGVVASELLDAQAARDEFRGYVARLLARPRAGSHADDELFGMLMEAGETERLSLDELVVMVFQLLLAGHETTSNLIANGLHALVSPRDPWKLLCENPERSEAVVEELLRFVSPVQFVERRALRDHELTGSHIAAGSSVVLINASANRDPDVFRDPDTLDISRADASRSLAFGLGPHYCLGAALARLEASVVLRVLAERHPGLHLVDPRVEWTGPLQLRRVRSLPAAL